MRLFTHIVMVIVRQQEIYNQVLVRGLLLSEDKGDIQRGLVINHQLTPRPFPLLPRLAARRKGKFIANLFFQRTVFSLREKGIRYAILKHLGVCQGGVVSENGEITRFREKYKYHYEHGHWIASGHIFQLLGFSYGIHACSALRSWQNFQKYCKATTHRSKYETCPYSPYIFSRRRLVPADALHVRISSRSPNEFYPSENDDLPF